MAPEGFITGIVGTEMAGIPTPPATLGAAVVSNTLGEIRPADENVALPAAAAIDGAGDVLPTTESGGLRADGMPAVREPPVAAFPTPIDMELVAL